MADVGTLRVKISADLADLKRGIEEAQKSVAGMSSKMKSVGSSMQNVGKSLSIGITAPLLLMGKIGMDELADIQKANAQTAAGIKSTGGAAGVSMKHIQSLAGSLQKLSGVDDQVIQSGQNLLLTFTKIQNTAGKGNDIFDQATKAALNLSVKGFGSMESASVMLGKALQDPVKGVTAMGRAGVTFSASQKAQIKAMTEAGNVAGAQKLILAELEKQVGGAAEAAGKTFPAKLAIMKDQVAGASASVVQQLLPAMTSLAETVGDLTTKFEGLTSGQKKWVGILAGSAAAAGPLLIVTGSLVRSVGELIPVLKALKVVMVTHPLFAGAVVAGAVIGVLMALNKLSQGANESTRAIQQAKTATDAFKASMDSLRGANLSAKEAQLQLKSASLNLKQAHESVTEAVKQSGKGSLQHRQALLAEKQAELALQRARDASKAATTKNNKAMADARRKAAEAGAELNRLRAKHGDLTTKVLRLEGALRKGTAGTNNTKRTLAELRQQLVAVENQLPKAERRFNAAAGSVRGVGKAATGSQGPLRSLVQTINSMRDKTVTLTVNQLTRRSGPFAQPNLPGMKPHARGGISNEAAIFGEAGPEAAVPLGNSRQNRADRARVMREAGLSGGGNTYITINANDAAGGRAAGRAFLEAIGRTDARQRAYNPRLAVGH